MRTKQFNFFLLLLLNQNWTGGGPVANITFKTMWLMGKNRFSSTIFQVWKQKKLISTVIFSRFCLIKRVLFHFFKYELVYTQLNKIWREKGIEKIILLVLLLAEFGVWCFQNLGFGASRIGFLVQKKQYFFLLTRVLHSSQ